MTSYNRARTARAYILGMIAAGAVACSNAGEDLGFDPVGNGTVAAFIYLDRNGDLLPTQGNVDTAFAGVRMGLVVAGTTDTAFTATTDALGNVVFNEVPFGNYQLIVDTNTVGDSIEVQAIDSANVRLRGNAQQQLVSVRLGFPALTIAEARVAAPGLRVFIKGMMLVGLAAFGDTTGHVIDNGVAIRLTNGTHGGPVTQPGDSVRILGTVSARAGQPVLDSAVIMVYRLSFTGPASTPLSTLLAGNADTTAQDAALVEITGALIQDTLTVGPDYHVVVDDGSGPVTMVLDGDGTFQRALFDIGKSVTAEGVLVPTGTGTWVFKPRNQADVTIT
jgi:hypothetical protein